MTTFSEADPTADVACSLPVHEVDGRLRALQDLVGDSLGGFARSDGRLRIRIERTGRVGLEAEVAAFAEAEKACCSFLGFAIESEPDAVTLEIKAPSGAESTLGGFEWIVGAAGGRGVG